MLNFHSILFCRLVPGITIVSQQLQSKTLRYADDVILHVVVIIFLSTQHTDSTYYNTKGKQWRYFFRKCTCASDVECPSSHKNVNGH